MLINKFLLEHSQIRSFTCCLWLLLYSTSRVEYLQQRLYDLQSLKHSLSGTLQKKFTKTCSKSIINTSTNTVVSNTIASSYMCQFEFKFKLIKIKNLVSQLPNHIFFFKIFFFKGQVFYLFIYFWLRCVFVAARGLSLVAASGGNSSLQCVGFSLWWLLFLQSMGSRRAGFSSCGTRAQ